MVTIKKCCSVLRKIVKKIAFQTKLREMDNMWYLTGGSSYGLFPPSFYYTHTEEEIERISKKTIERLKEMIEKTKVADS